MPEIPEQFTDLIRRFEGLRLHAYYCPAGVLTCGYGSTGPDIKPDTVWTIDQAEARVQKDATMFYHAVCALLPHLNDSQTCAIADFAYNLGLTRLRSSTLFRKLKANDIPGAAAELRRWVHGGGRILPGLVARREAEIQLLFA